MMWILRTIIVFGTLSALAYYVLCLRGARWFLNRRRSVARRGFTPPVSILKPLCGADPKAYESLRSHCVQDYPEFEIIFGVSDPKDAAIPLVRRLMDEFPERKMQLVMCRKFLGSNYKISNLIQMLPLAGYDYVLVNDSDIAVSSGYLQQVMAEFQNSRVGLVTCLYRGIAGRSLGAKLEALGISVDFIPGVLSAQLLEDGIRFGLGSTLAFSRRALNSIGGFECVADYLGDDYELGKRVFDSGYAVALAQCIVDHHLPEYSFVDYFRHQLRWARTTRHSRPWGYAGLVFTFGFAWSMAGVIVTPLALWTWLLVGFVLVVRYAVAFTVGIKILKDGQLWRNFWLIPLRDVIGVGVWAASFAGRRIVWRGNQFTLENGKLRS